MTEVSLSERALVFSGAVPKFHIEKLVGNTHISTHVLVSPHSVERHCPFADFCEGSRMVTDPP